MIDLNHVITSCREIEPLPPSAARLAALAAEGNIELEAVAEIVTYDPALTARVLRIASSVEGSSARSIQGVTEALMRTGTDLAVQLAMGGAVRGTLGASESENRPSEEALRRQSKLDDCYRVPYFLVFDLVGDRSIFPNAEK